ncbi:MAG: acyl carrier protein [Acidobacteria bacterium]|nr:acyl carrier protein [Acidobacteriota bacterium]MCB9397585.1 acyl carrier protein [Acidobacteriota bacterium]
MSDVFNQVKSLIAEQLEVDEEQITMDSMIVDDLGADSLDVVELIMHLEEKFSIEIPESESEKIVSVGDVVRFIEGNS